MSAIGKMRRKLAALALDRVDAEVARWYVDDGTLSDAPLSSVLSTEGRELRARRIAAVERLVRAGGRDPWPHVLRIPTEAQREGYRLRFAPPPSPAEHEQGHR